jgi:ADP-heptose:LPS heptosyltransferase
VLVLRPDGLGDMVLFSGAFRHLRSHYADYEIVVAASAVGTEYLRHCPYVDRLIPCAPPLRRRFALLRAHWSVVLQPVRLLRPRHHKVVRLLSATEKHGIARDVMSQTAEADRAADAIYTSRLELAADRRTDHELSVTRDFLRHLGIDVDLDAIWPEAWTTSEDRRWAEAHVSRTAGRLTLAVAPASSYEGKIYPPDRYRSVVAGLGDVPLDVVLFGTARDVAVCNAVEAAITGGDAVRSVTNLAGTTTIGQMVEGLRRASAVLAVDSAPLHLATALRRPVVGILGGGHFGRFYPWGNPATTWVANKTLDCYGCNWDCRYETTRCVEEIPPSLIADQLHRALRAAREVVPG